MTTFGARLTESWATFGRLCVGVDPHAFLLESWGLSDDAAGAREFGYRVVDACAGRVGIIKPQVAFFERFGSIGLAALEDVTRLARDADLIVISDAKRGDIGSTMEGYADAWLARTSPLAGDAVTLSPYLGVTSLEPTVSRAASDDRGVFILAVTSNPEAATLQHARDEDSKISVAASVVDFARRHVSGACGHVGVVLGAQTRLDSYGIDAEALTGVPILAPGFGAQGARVHEARSFFGPAVSTLIVAQSRSVLDAGPGGIVESVHRASGEVADALG